MMKYDIYETERYIWWLHPPDGASGVSQYMIGPINIPIPDVIEISSVDIEIDSERTSYSIFQHLPSIES